MKLECVLTATLNGNVMSMRAVSLPGISRDALLISFMDCKLALVDYNSHTHDLRTLSLHYFEEEPDFDWSQDKEDGIKWDEGNYNKYSQTDDHFRVFF